MLSSARQIAASAAALAVLAAFPAAAQEVKTAAADQAAVEECLQRYSAKDRDVACAAEKFIENQQRQRVEAQRRGAEADRRGAEADRREAQADAASPCLDYLKDLVTSGAKDAVTGQVITKAAVNAKADGKVTIENACTTAAAFGYDRRAGLTTPQL